MWYDETSPNLALLHSLSAWEQLPWFFFFFHFMSGRRPLPECTISFGLWLDHLILGKWICRAHPWGYSLWIGTQLFGHSFLMHFVNISSVRHVKQLPDYCGCTALYGNFKQTKQQSLSHLRWSSVNVLTTLRICSRILIVCLYKKNILQLNVDAHNA